MFLKISDAANIGIHALIYMAKFQGYKRAFTTTEMASEFDISSNHLSKVLQRLTRAGLIKSIRGPKGGFILAHSPEKITLKSIYEAIDGQLLSHGDCLLGGRQCGLKTCVFGGLVGDVNSMVYNKLSGATLADISQ